MEPVGVSSPMAGSPTARLPTKLDSEGELPPSSGTGLPLPAPPENTVPSAPNDVADANGGNEGKPKGQLPSKGSSIQATLGAGAQVFGSMFKNLGSMQGSEKKTPEQKNKTSLVGHAEELSEQRTETDQTGNADLENGPLAQSTKHSYMGNADLRNGPLETSSVKQGFGSGLTLASLGSRFQSLRQTAVKAVAQPVRHLVSQNKRRYIDGNYDLDLSYITENIIAMGFPAGDLSSGLFGYVEGFYRNHMVEVVRFLDEHHKGKCKIFNLCSERLYDSSLFEGLVACFPFEDHNCPPLPMLKVFCDSAYDWLKKDKNHMVVVHCKAGKSRTGLMICCLLLYLKLFDSADEAIKFYNGKRCTDGQGLTLPSQIRYVHYFESILRSGGKTPLPAPRVLRGVRLHRCPYWIRPSIEVLDHNGVIFSTKKHPRTKDLNNDDLWHKAPRKGVVVFALPGERCVADLSGDFKVLFHDRHGDFYCWLNTSMIGTRQFLQTTELDWFDRRRLPSPGFQVEIVVLDPANQAARAESGSTASTSELDPPESLAPRTLDGPTGFGTLSGLAKGRPEDPGDPEKGSGKGGRLKTTKEREEDEVFGESDEEKGETRPSTAVPSTPAPTTPALGTLSAHLPPGKTVPSSVSPDATPPAVQEVPLKKPLDPPVAKPLPTPVIKSSTAIAPQPTSEVLTAVDPAPSTAGRDSHTETVPEVQTGKATPLSNAGVSAPTTTTGAAASKADGVKLDSKEGVGTGGKDGLVKVESRAPGASVELGGPSIANSLLADDWEADVFGTDDAASGEGSASQGVGQAKAGPAAVTSEFAKLAVAGSADAGEFTLGDEDDFDSDDGF